MSVPADSPRTHAALVREFFGDCDCRVVGEAESEAYARDWATAESALAALVALADRQREALERVRENARSWHGPEGDKGHERALAVIATWCDEVLAGGAGDE